jgi:hypothetical protein
MMQSWNLRDERRLWERDRDIGLRIDIFGASVSHQTRNHEAGVTTG